MTHQIDDPSLGPLQWQWRKQLGGYWRGRMELPTRRAVELIISTNTGLASADPELQDLLTAARSATAWLRQSEPSVRLAVADDRIEQYNLRHWKWGDDRFPPQQLAERMELQSIDVQNGGSLALFYVVIEREPRAGGQSGVTIVACFGPDRRFNSASWFDDYEGTP